MKYKATKYAEFGGTDTIYKITLSGGGMGGIHIKRSEYASLEELENEKTKLQDDYQTALADIEDKIQAIINEG